ncbi:MAG: S53 family peptidase [Mycobacteriales bacterium]
MQRRAGRPNPFVGSAVRALAVVVAAAAALAGIVAPARSAPALASPPTPEQCLAATGGRCLTPALLQKAYDLQGLYGQGLTGAGVTIGIVDSFGSPTLAHDLAVYDAQYHLPELDLQVISPVGTPPAFDGHDSDVVGWAAETTLDVEVAHSVAPGAKIVLIETPTSETEGLQGFPEILRAEGYVLDHDLVDVISQSFAATEPTFTGPAEVRGLSAQVYPRARAAGVTVVSSSGDNGPTDVQLDQKTLYDRRVVDWPASDPLVTSVGGTRLDLGADGGREAPDQAWGGDEGAGGGGLSAIFARPAYQDPVSSVVGDHRGIPDISLDASTSSGVITYGSYDGGGWSLGGGTSQAAPILAGIVALADQKAHARVGFLNDALYGTLATSPAGGIVDVTRGSDDLGAGSSVPGYAARRGYDLATGLGTVDAGRFVPAVVAATASQRRPLASADGGPASPDPAGAGDAIPRAHATGTASGPSVPLVTGLVVAAVLLAAGGGTGLVLRRRRPRRTADADGSPPAVR